MKFRMRVQHNRDYQWEEILEVEAESAEEAAQKAKDELIDTLEERVPVISTYGEAVLVDDEDEDAGEAVLDW